MAFPRILSISLLILALSLVAYKPVWRLWLLGFGPAGVPDVTVVLLNWSRFSNIQLIVNTLCSAPALQAEVEGFVVWNNNPNLTVTTNDFACPTAKVTVINSSKNEYFKARYPACLLRHSKYCYFQDDDFLVQPSVISLLRHEIETTQSEIFLAPPDEILRSRLRAVSTAYGVHTSFAWLGYGSMLLRDHVSQFSGAMDALNMLPDEKQMADNYFTVLRNAFPNVWVVSPPALKELGGGQPFTVGQEGDDRNNKYILQAARLLDSIVPQEALRARIPYVSRENDTEMLYRHKAPFANAACLLEANIPLLPSFSDVIMELASQILEVESMRMKHLDESIKQDYLSHPLSHAVDTYHETFFRAPSGRRTADELSITCLSSQLQGGKITLEVDTGTVMILQASTATVSRDGQAWVHAAMNCRPKEQLEHRHLCSFSSQTLNHVRLRRGEDQVSDPWTIYEISISRDAKDN